MFTALATCNVLTWANNTVRGALGMALLLAALTGAWAAEPTREEQFKAAYLFNFLKFVDWPPSVPQEVLTLCFIGGNGVYETLESNIDTKRAGARQLAVRRLPPKGSVDGCNVLYVEGRFAADARPALDSARSALTVSDAAAFAQRGGMIELFTEDNRLRFRINVDRANKAGLRISSDLLQLAAAIERDADS